MLSSKHLNSLIKYLLLFFVVILLGGCFQLLFPYRVGYEPENSITHHQVTQYELQIKPGKTTRAEIETLLEYGKPFIDNPSWGLSAYRRALTDGGVVLFLIYPIGYVTDEDTLILFVVYDEKDLVKGYDITYRIENGQDWFIGSKTDYDIEFPESTGGYIYDFMGDTLLASPEISEELLISLPTKGNCSIIMARQDVKNLIMTNVYVDDRHIMGYNPISDEGFVRLDVPPGLHLVEVRSPSDHSWQGELKRSIDCQAGQKYFLSIAGTVDTSFWNPSFSGEISEVDQTSDIFHDRRAIIYLKGDWLIPEKIPMLTKSKSLDIPFL